jgi:small subunit ribosomal protein S16
VLRIRLTRVGAKKKPAYRIVVAESASKRDGAAVDVLGQYNPRTEPTTINVDAEKARQWLSRGAQPSDRVARLFSRVGIT